MAVPVGFEPTVLFQAHNFSRVAPSAARTRHRRTAYVTRGDGANRPTSAEIDLRAGSVTT